MADVNIENYMMNFRLKINNDDINFHAEVPSNDCVFLWVGQESTATMAYGLLRHRSVIYGNPTPHAAFQINEFASRLAKLFTNRQVFVSTDIDQDNDPKFWTSIFLALKEYILAHREFFRLVSDQHDTDPATPASTTSSQSAAESQQSH